MKIVIDANVYASCLIKPEGTSGKVLRYLLNNEEYSIIGLAGADEQKVTV